VTERLLKCKWITGWKLPVFILSNSCIIGTVYLLIVSIMQLML
jgi:hypothetical protein